MTTLRLIFCFLACVAWAACSARECTGIARQEPRTVASMLLRGDAFAGVVAAGEVRTVAAGADAEIYEVHVTAGTPVSPGALLMTLASPDVEDELRSTAQLAAERDAALRSARANLQLFDSRVARRERNPLLFAAEEREALRHEREVAAAALEAAQAAAKRAEIDHTRARARQDALVLRSPAAGLVVGVLGGRGERVGRGTALLRLASPPRLQVRFAVPTARQDVGVGSRVCVLADRDTTAFPARISAIAASADPVLGAHVASAEVDVEDLPRLQVLPHQPVLVQPSSRGSVR